MLVARLSTFALLIIPLLVAPLAAQSTRGEQMEKALAHVRAQEYEAGLTIFRALVTQSSRDYEARNWVARLESWRKNYALAEQLYREVWAEDPDNLEAELGLVDVLSWQGRYPEAMERLRGWLTLQPKNTEVLLRLGKLSHWERKRDQALRYYREVLALDPGNTEAREAVDILVAQTPFQIETGYLLEEFDFAGSTQGQFVQILYRDHHRLTLLGRFQHQDKFGQNNTRGTAGITYRFWKRTWVRGEFSWAPAGDTVIANQDYTLELVQGLHPRLAVGSSYRFLNFRGADVQVVTALLNWDLHRKLHLYVRYTPARTRFQLPARSVWNHGGWTRLVWDAHRRVSPYLLFAVAAENFTGVSADQLGRFAAQTYGGGAVVHLTPAQGFRLGYYFQNRTQDRREQGFGISYFFSF